MYNLKFNDSTISLNHRVHFTYAQPVVSNAFDMQTEEESTLDVLLSKAFML